VKLRIFIAVLAMASGGCAVQPISQYVKDSDLEMLTVNSGQAKFMDAVANGQPLPGTEGVGFLPYVSAGEFIAGAVGSGIVHGNVQTGIAIQQAITSSRSPPESKQAFRTADLYSASMTGLMKSAPAVAHEPPAKGIFATPFITLHEMEGGQFSHSCAVNFSGYMEGQKKWTFVGNHASALLSPTALQDLEGQEFQRASRSCFRLVGEVFVEYAKGKYDGKFRGGRVTLKNGTTRSGTFVRDDERGVTLQVLVSASPQGMIVIRSDDLQSVSFD
jgi:hypothetical protein